VAEITRQGGDPTRVVGRRILGGFLEGIIDSVLLAGLASILGISIEQSAAFTPVPGNASEEEAQLAALALVYLGYFVATKVVTLTLWGWTPGMLCVGVRCVRWDGRPPGLLRAFWRSAFFSFLYLLCGGFFLLPMAIAMSYTKAHRALQDLVAGTFVIDNQWFGHMVIVGSDRVSAGPMSVRREEAAKMLKAEGIEVPLGARLPPNAKNGNPFMDKQLDTYVVWNARQERFLAFDKASGAWEPLD
jgi:uncharacterized RDD family membrane protein YckC